MVRLTRSAKIAAGIGVAALAVAVPSGSAQAPGSTTLSFYEPDAGSTFRFIDNAPKSPSKNPESSKYRFSVGDEVVLASPLFDKKGGTRLGKVYAEGTIVSGKTFRDIRVQVSGTYVLNDASQIAVQGVFVLSKPSTAAVVGGTGRYEGARGHLSSTSDETSSTDTLTLLP